ncbi:MAG: phosphopentomutase [Thermoleophilia bacterium]
MLNPLWLLSRRKLRRKVRCLLITLDGVGVGALPDAAEFGDTGVNTLAHVAAAAGGLNLPNLGALGIGNIIPLPGQPPVPRPQALYGKLAERSRGKDTTVGHWELMGAITTEPFPVYPHGFPEAVIEEFSRRTGRGVLGNMPASGTDIIRELGEQHLRTGDLIVYTSTDSVFQIAAHEEIVPPDELYRYCLIAREILTGEHQVVRVIARPFTGAAGSFTRTGGRRDFSLTPPRTYLNIISEIGVPVHGVGKIHQIFAGVGVRFEHKTANNAEGIEQTISLLKELEEGLIFTNLVDFDMLWGHRNDATGFARGLEALDTALPGILAACGPDDLLIITADHGCDPLAPGTDHTREYIPLMARLGNEFFSPGGPLFHSRPRGATVREQVAFSASSPYEGEYADVGASILEFFTGRRLEVAEAMRMPGRSFIVISKPQ